MRVDHVFSKQNSFQKLYIDDFIIPSKDVLCFARCTLFYQDIWKIGKFRFVRCIGGCQEGINSL